MTSSGPGRVRIGVAGWDYPDWAGAVYPASARRGFDRLGWIARWVDLIEINSSFYRPVAPRTAESWARRVADRPNFVFTAKCHRSWTHDPVVDLDAAVPPTLDGLEPLRAAGRLGCLLLQFPQSFHFTPGSTERVERLAERAVGWPLTVEVRHTSWDEPEAEAWLRALGIGFCLVDQPRVGGSTLGPVARVTASHGYARLHGRNARDWFRPDAGRDARYDYCYDRDELAGLAAPIAGMAEQVAEVYVVQNNHFRGQALANALQLRHLVEGRRPAAPEELVLAWPGIEPDVEVERTRLF